MKHWFGMWVYTLALCCDKAKATKLFKNVSLKTTANF